MMNNQEFVMNDINYLAYINRQAAILDYTSDMHGARTEGKNQILRLIGELSRAKRFDEIAKLDSDEKLVEKLYKEFGIE